MEGGGDCIIRRAVWTVCKLQRVKCVGEAVLMFVPDLTSQSTHHDWSQLLWDGSHFERDTGDFFGTV